MYNWRNVDNHEGIHTYIVVRLGKAFECSNAFLLFLGR